MISRRILLALQQIPFITRSLRRKLLRWAGITIADNSGVLAHVFFGSAKVSIAQGAFLSVRSLIDGSDTVRIGCRVHLAPAVRIITSSHAIGDTDCRAGTPRNAPVAIEDGAWIGAGAIILPGVTIARGCVIGAGAVVTRDTQPDGLYVGAPARRVRDLPLG